MELYTEILVARAKSKDKGAIDAIVKIYHPRIFNFCYRYLDDYDKAMDVTQRSFISMLKNISKLKDNNKFNGWMYQIALNYCKDEQRKEKEGR